MSIYDFNPKTTSEDIISYIENNVSRPALIGLSGGIDSSLTCTLTAKALGSDNVEVLVMENDRYDAEGLQRARDLAQEKSIEIETVETNRARTALQDTLGIDELHQKKKSATLDARICDDILRNRAKEDERLYVGTINGTERLTGWHPKGELVGDICPIGGLLKAQVKAMATYHGMEELTDTVSEDASKVCSGCGKLEAFEGIPYDILDRTLYQWESKNPSQFWDDIATNNILQEHAKTIIERVKQVQHKRKLFPPYPTVNTT